MKLPNAERAVVNIEKLRDYSLNLNHPKGKHKARVFLNKLGLEAKDAERLRELILKAVLTTDAVEQQPAAYGRRFVVDFQGENYIKHVAMFAVIRTAWIIRKDEDFPRLTTCFIL